MAVKKAKKPAAKSIKSNTVKAAAKKSARAVSAKLPAKKIIAKKALKPVLKKIVTKPTVKSKVKKLINHTVKSEKIQQKTMAKTDAKPRNFVRSKESKLQKRFEEPVVVKAAPRTIERQTETRLTRQVDTETAAKFSSKYTVGDISQFQIKIPKKGMADASTEERLQALFQLQQIDSEIDRIRNIRGELPVEVKDLEDEVAGLETRISNYKKEVEEFEKNILDRKQAIKDANAAIRKYESQQNNVKNNREYESLNKEIEYQRLEIQLCEKRIKEYQNEIVTKNQIIEASTITHEERKNDLETKKKELKTIVAETEKEEEALLGFSEKAGKIIEDRLLQAYKKIRDNASNGLAVVTIQRDSCGGCFNKIPPQRQLDIRTHKKVIVCEHCGRILVDQDIMKAE